MDATRGPQPSVLDVGLLESVAASSNRIIFASRLRKSAGFAWAVLNALGAGSITCFSIFGHLLQEHRGYSQINVATLSIAAGIATYLIVPAFGFLTDKKGPWLSSILAGSIMSLSYILAGVCYRSGIPSTFGGPGLPYWLMVSAFIGVGSGTGGLYLSGLDYCAKMFSGSSIEGTTMAIPVAAFGLSGMCFSQIGSRLLYEKNPDGSRGDINVASFFFFLSFVLFVLGVGGSVLLRVRIDNPKLDRAMTAEPAHTDDAAPPASGQIGLESDHPSGSDDCTRHPAVGTKRAFLTDRTMWLLATGFLLATGSSETFINNIGVIIKSLFPSHGPTQALPTSAATHVSIVAIFSTISRLVVGVLSDRLSPSSRQGQIRLADPEENRRRSTIVERFRSLRVSRVVFLLVSALILAFGQALLATGLAESNHTIFSVVSSCIGTGYGAVFALVPIIVPMIWGKENFGFNWGIVATTAAIGSAFWGVVYSYLYSLAVGKTPTSLSISLPIEGWAVGPPLQPLVATSRTSICVGKECYSAAFWLMACGSLISCSFWLLAWKGPRGWKARSIPV